MASGSRRNNTCNYPSRLMLLLVAIVFAGFSLQVSLHRLTVSKRNSSSSDAHYGKHVAIGVVPEGGVPERSKVHKNVNIAFDEGRTEIPRNPPKSSQTLNKEPVVGISEATREISQFADESIVPFSLNPTTAGSESISKAAGIPYTPTTKRKPDWNYIHQGQAKQQQLDELTKLAGKVYCAIPSLYTESKLRVWTAILQTYGGRCDEITFFVDPVNPTGSVPSHFSDQSSSLTARVVELPMVRESGSACQERRKVKPGTLARRLLCKNIWEKVWRMWVWVFEHDLDKASWFVKVDDDTFFFPENLKYFVAQQGWSGTDPHYFGHRLQHSKYLPLVAGGAAVMSREALRRVGPVYAHMPRVYKDHDGRTPVSCIDRDGPFEEVSTSICLETVGVRAEDGCDTSGRERVLTFPAVDHLAMTRGGNSTGWYWKNKEPWKQGGELCCSTRPIAHHRHKLPQYLEEINHVVYARESPLAQHRRTYQAVPEGTKVRSIIQKRNKYPVEYVRMEIEYYEKVRRNLMDMSIDGIRQGLQ